MAMPQMMGASEQNVDPLHLQSFVPQNENVNINNYGVNPSQLKQSSQMGGARNNFAGYDRWVNFWAAGNNN
jgi:hypothetical protein